MGLGTPYAYNQYIFYFANKKMIEGVYKGEKKFEKKSYLSNLKSRGL